METQTILNQNNSKMNIGFFFLSLGVLASLVTSVVSFLDLLFSTLDKKFPDVLNASYQYGYNTYDFESMRSALATLIIFFPVFLLLSYFWKKKYKIGVGHIDEIIRKWMLYIILFLSSLVIIIDLVTLVRYFIAGEITNRFIFKVLGALLVAVFVGVHYIFELKKREKFLNLPVGIVSVIKSTAWVILLIWFAFCVMGSPFKQRALRLDDKRIQDLQSIQWQIVNYYQQKEKLPENLKDLKDPISGYSLPVDPEFGKGINYEYAVLDAKALKFKLCATFALPIPEGWNEYGRSDVMPLGAVSNEGKDVAISSYPYSSPSGVNESWKHDVGYTCFERIIDKEIYKPYPKPL